jgi:hypothetical protein
MRLRTCAPGGARPSAHGWRGWLVRALLRTHARHCGQPAPPRIPDGVARRSRILLRLLARARAQRRALYAASLPELLAWVGEEPRPGAQALLAVRLYLRCVRAVDPREHPAYRSVLAPAPPVSATPFAPLAAALLEPRGERVRDARDDAVLCLLFARVPARRIRTLRDSLIERTGDGITLHDPTLDFQPIVLAVTPSPGCPVRALEHWLAVRPAGGAYVFGKLDQWQNLHPRALSEVGLTGLVRARAARAGLGLSPGPIAALLAHGATRGRWGDFRLQPDVRRGGVRGTRHWYTALPGLRFTLRCSCNPLGGAKKDRLWLRILASARLRAYRAHGPSATTGARRLRARRSRAGQPSPRARATCLSFRRARVLLWLVRWSRRQGRPPWRLSLADLHKWLLELAPQGSNWRKASRWLAGEFADSIVGEWTAVSARRALAVHVECTDLRAPPRLPGSFEDAAPEWLVARDRALLALIASRVPLQVLQHARLSETECSADTVRIGDGRGSRRIYRVTQGAGAADVAGAVREWLRQRPPTPSDLVFVSPRAGSPRSPAPLSHQLLYAIIARRMGNDHRVGARRFLASLVRPNDES